jgi:hypothetical protein
MRVNFNGAKAETRLNAELKATCFCGVSSLCVLKTASIP